MRLRPFLMVIITAFCLSACATAKRGSKQMFMVETTPPGAKVETTLVENRAPRLTEKEYAAIKAGDKPEPELAFKSCEPTPCGFELSRKLDFDILVTKEGYGPQVHTIDHFHRKEIAKQIKKEVALSTAVVGTGAAALGVGTVALGTTVASVGTATASTGALAAGAALFAAPVAGIALLSVGVDSSTGANYDYWPNPAALTLETIEASENENSLDTEQAFYEARKAAYIRPYPSRAMIRYENEQRAKARKDRLENDRLFQNYVSNPPPDTSKPQSGRMERRQEKRRKKAAEREKK